jgi:cellulose synthase/poly-beta-1,6-N-acetylglucosamine synthase-like glycosyltransferase
LLRNYIFWIFFFATILDSILFVLSLVAVDYPNPPLEGVPALDLQFYANRTQALRDCALIIPHYGPSGPIEASLKYALQLFPPDKIYVCHNGPSNAPMDRAGKLLDTYNCVKRVSQWYREQTGRMDAPDINYTWTSEGSKSASIFEGVLFASREKYVCVMDNDCLLPKDLSIPTILMERKDRVHALAFVIRAANFYCADGKRNLWPAYQDLEYKKAALAKLFQAQMATCLFAHGAVASWRRETLSSVMLRHKYVPYLSCSFC